jgi:hypothetical protein
MQPVTHNNVFDDALDSSNHNSDSILYQPSIQESLILIILIVGVAMKQMHRLQSQFAMYPKISINQSSNKR